MWGGGAFRIRNFSILLCYFNFIIEITQVTTFSGFSLIYNILITRQKVELHLTVKYIVSM